MSEEAARPNLSTNLSTETTSPDGQWTATTIFQQARGSDEYYQSLVVTHASGSPSYTLVDETLPMGLGYTTAEPLTWSLDGERFYYTNVAHPDGCGLMVNGSDLYQVDLVTGETTEILPPNTTTKIGLAPDEQHVAYFAIGEPAILIHDLASDEIASLDLAPLLGEGEQAGAIVWSPDTNAFAFAIAHNPCSGGWAEATSIYIVDAGELTTVSHLEMDDRLLIPVAWPSAKTLLLQNQEGQQFRLDLATNTVSPSANATITATETIT
jgi:hypothetical protein